MPWSKGDAFHGCLYFELELGQTGWSTFAEKREICWNWLRVDLEEGVRASQNAGARSINVFTRSQVENFANMVSPSLTTKM